MVVWLTDWIRNCSTQQSWVPCDDQHLHLFQLTSNTTICYMSENFKYKFHTPADWSEWFLHLFMSSFTSHIQRYFFILFWQFEQIYMCMWKLNSPTKEEECDNSTNTPTINWTRQCVLLQFQSGTFSIGFSFLEQNWLAADCFLWAGGKKAPDSSNYTECALTPAGSNLDHPLHFVTVSSYGFLYMLRC